MFGPPAPVRAADNASIPYAKLASWQDAFLAIPAARRDKISFAWVVAHTDRASHAAMHMWVETGGKRTEVPVAADGTIALPVRPDWGGQGVSVQTDLPRHTASVTISLLIRPYAGHVMPVSYLADATVQAQAAVEVGARQAGGMLAMLAAPTLRVVRATVPGCCAQTVRLQGKADGPVWRQDAQGVVRIPLAALRAEAGGTLSFSVAATRLDPEPD